jgi:hypothetical protein
MESYGNVFVSFVLISFVNLRRGGYDSIDIVTARLRSASRCSEEAQLDTLWQSIAFCIFGKSLRHLPLFH